MSDDKRDFQKPEVYLERIARDIRTILNLVSGASNASTEAESEIPEKMRRFTMYAHDVHSIVRMYEERGLQVPDWVLREMERIDDRYRQLLTEAHHEDGAFAKVRREMAEDKENRWDHTRQLSAPKENSDETGNRSNNDGSNEDGA